MRSALALSLVLLLMLISCSGNRIASLSNTNATPIPQTTPEPTPELLAAEAVFSAFRNAQIPMVDEIQYNEENDPNSLLGRPNQYVGKISWTDSRAVKKVQAKRGNTIEVFANDADLEARKKYTEAISKSSGMFNQYIFSHKNVLLRLDHQLLPREAAEYESLLKSL